VDGENAPDPFAGRSAYFAEHYGTTRGRLRLELVLGRLRDRLPAAPARVLDAGGGTGAFALPLAKAGYDVTLLDPSEEWLGVAAAGARSAGVAVRTVVGRAEEARGLVGDGGSFDAVLCHTVLIYAPEPTAVLSELRAVAREGALLSVLEKNFDALSFRPGRQGDSAEALRTLDDPVASGGLGIPNRAFRVGELRAQLVRTGWRPESWAGIRVFSDPPAPEAPDDVAFQGLLELERVVSTRDPYRRAGRLIHLLGSARPSSVASLAEIQAESFARAGAGTRESFPEKKVLTAEELAGFLARKGYATLATARADGRPHAAMIGFVEREGRIWIPSVAAAVRLRNLTREPSATLVVNDGEGDDHVVAIIEGECVVHDDVEPILEAFLRDAWRERFATELDWAGAIIELVPTKVLSYGRGRVE
jgi:S-adenosylmethionine-dependent methyltransferase